MRRSRFKPLKASKASRSRSSGRRGALRENSKATEVLYEFADIQTGRSARIKLRTAASRLDDVELETAWRAAVRGDYVVASERLSRTVEQGGKLPVKRKPKGWTPWRNALLPRRK